MKRIGLLIQNLNAGGAERVAARLSVILKDQYEVFLIIFQDTEEKYDYSGTLINLNIKAKKCSLIRKLFLPFKRANKLKKLKKKLKLDAVISFVDSPNIVNVLSRLPECKTILSIRNYPQKYASLPLAARITDFIMRCFYNRADKVVAVSKTIEESLIRDYHVHKDKICTIYNPYNIEEIQRLSKEEIEENYKTFLEGNKVFISIGRQVYQKGFWHLIKAFKAVHDKVPNTRLILIGKGEQEEQIKQLIHELGISDEVLLLGYQRNPFKYIKNSDVYVLSSLFEGFPNAMVEAMACGCPVVADDCKSGPREILYKNSDINQEVCETENAEYGMIVPRLNLEENWKAHYLDESDEVLAQAMYQMISNESLCKQYSKQGMLRAGEFNFNVCKKQFMTVIESL